MQFLFALVFLAAALASSVSYSQALPVTAVPVWTPAVVGSVYTFNGAVASSANAAMLSFSNASNGPVYAQATQGIALGGGRSASVVIRSAPTALGVAKAVGNLAAKASAIGYALNVGSAVYDLAKELGFDISVASGAPVYQRSDPTVCTVAPCYDYAVNNGSGTAITSFYSSKPSACEAARIYAQNTGGRAFVVTSSSPNCALFGNSQYDTYTWNYRTRTAAPAPSAYVPSSRADFEDAIAAKPAWPSTSAISRAVTDAVASGEPLALPSPSSITGPASVAGPTSVVSKPAVGTSPASTVTTNITNNITYGPSTVTVTQVTVTTSSDPAVAPTTATGEPPPELKLCGLPGGPACKIDETGTPSNPIKASDTDLQAVKDAQTSLLEKVSSVGDKNWTWTFIGAPPVAACESMPLPPVFGITPPDLNPCGTVDGIRAVMAWIWAFVGFYVCIGYVREVI